MWAREAVGSDALPDWVSFITSWTSGLNKVAPETLARALLLEPQGEIRARVDQGVWIAYCPNQFCGGAEAVWDEPAKLFFCPYCGNINNDGRLYRITIPIIWRVIEQLLEVRPARMFQNWEPGKSRHVLALENEAGFHRSYTIPKTYYTGNVLTAPELNTYQRDNISFLGSSHAHAATAGDGADLGLDSYEVTDDIDVIGYGGIAFADIDAVNFTLDIVLRAESYVLVLMSCNVQITTDTGWVEVKIRDNTTPQDIGSIEHRMDASRGGLEQMHPRGDLVVPGRALLAAGTYTLTGQWQVDNVAPATTVDFYTGTIIAWVLPR